MIGRILLAGALLVGHLNGRAQVPDPVETTGASILGPSAGADTTGTKKKKYKVNIGGVLQAHYLNEFNTNGDTVRDPDGFRMLRARLIAKGRINKFTTYELMVDPRAPEQGGIMRDAFVAFALGKHQILARGPAENPVRLREQRVHHQPVHGEPQRTL